MLICELISYWLLVCSELQGYHAFLAFLWCYMLNKSSRTHDDMRDFLHSTLSLTLMYQHLEQSLC